MTEVVEVGLGLDWPAIEVEERRVAAMATTLPRCSICTRPMWLAQPGRHHTCATDRTVAPTTEHEGDQP
jgi:hypothetical protein